MIAGCTHFVPIADDEKDQARPAQVEPTVVEVASRAREA